LKTIKLILQPVVENAIYHGVKEKEGHGTILIDVRLDNGMLDFVVSDDGAGMTEEKLAEIREGFSSGDVPRDSGYGLFNINQRIRLACGTDGGVRIESIGGKRNRGVYFASTDTGELNNVESLDRGR